MKNIILLISVQFVITFGIAQNVPIFHWADHLSYKSGVAVAEGNGKVYCVTKSGIFAFNKGDNSMDRLSKINGLSDVQGKVVGFNHTVNKAIICYENSNIDIIDNSNSIINISDIKRKNIIGDKHIYNVYFSNQFAYLACGFGIVVIDMYRMEVSDTYYIGTNGNAMKVYDITSDDTYFYVATEVGVYKAFFQNTNLADFNNWHRVQNLPTGKYSTIAAFQGKIYVNRSKFLENGVIFQDLISVYNPVDTSWNPWFQSSGYTVRQLRVFNNKLGVVMMGSAALYDSIIGSTAYSSWFFGGPSSYVTDANSAAYDSNGDMWIADGNNGLVSWRHSYGSEYHYPNGPASEKTFGMSCSGGNLLVVPGGYDVSAYGLWRAAEIYTYKDNTWTNLKGAYPSVVGFDTLLDLVNTLVDPADEKHGFASSWEHGVIELYNNIPVKYYNNTNSTLGVAGSIKTDGMAMDANGTLWVGNSSVPHCLVKKSSSGTWSAIDFTSMIGAGGAYVRQVLIDKNDQKWVALQGKGMMVCASGNYSTASSANTKILTSASGNGALPSVNVYCMAEDKNGEIWVGTDKGISVFYSPENAFVSGQNFDSQQILLTQDGHVQILLLTELVQAIAVDDANRKWIATANSGVFLMSADGTQQIYHFDENNSPLFSNDVRTIAINHKTGEVFFGTAKGIIEFRGSATESNDDCSGMYAFPNPVKPDYTGPIAIKGMSESSTVKITDISGTLVYETTSEGGQALWYGTNFKGERVSTGVYMVFCTSVDGSQKCVSKILFIN